MPVAEDSPLAPLTKDGAWQQHARSFDSAFGHLDQGQLARIRAWSEKNITAPPPTRQAPANCTGNPTCKLRANPGGQCAALAGLQVPGTAQNRPKKLPKC